MNSPEFQVHNASNESSSDVSGMALATGSRHRYQILVASAGERHSAHLQNTNELRPFLP
jgi:hypothetical protein